MTNISHATPLTLVEWHRQIDSYLDIFKIPSTQHVCSLFQAHYTISNQYYHCTLWEDGEGTMNNLSQGHSPALLPSLPSRVGKEILIAFPAKGQILKGTAVESHPLPARWWPWSVVLTLMSELKGRDDLSKLASLSISTALVNQHLSSDQHGRWSTGQICSWGGTASVMGTRSSHQFTFPNKTEGTTPCVAQHNKPNHKQQ